MSHHIGHRQAYVPAFMSLTITNAACAIAYRASGDQVTETLMASHSPSQYLKCLDRPPASWVRDSAGTLSINLEVT
ncbi:hypothetical protein B0I37DRAFT_20245 [Chaetomium sp. MPI-CAGE-AT-0009]|nr:hypothetical protein B0I37DRAFT_20245 [Chaetomium sp. MPI-CAGE-AT-0009]